MGRKHDSAEAARRASAEGSRAWALREKPWTKSTGPRSAKGRRTVTLNATKHGADSMAVWLAIRYAEGVAKALKQRAGI